MGLDCTEEVASLRSALNGVPGIAELRFEVLSGKMTVVCTPDGCESEAIVSAVASTGMKAVLWQDRGRESSGTFWQQRGRLVMTVASGCLIAVGSVVHWNVLNRRFMSIPSLACVECRDSTIFYVVNIGSIVLQIRVECD